LSLSAVALMPVVYGFRSMISTVMASDAMRAAIERR
jgi:hypothetical protein